MQLASMQPASVNINKQNFLISKTKLLDF